MTAYDSLYLSITQQPQIETSSNGKSALVVRARARTPGETSVEISRVGPGKGPERVTFKVRILE